jgi:hypothetical protein
MKWFRDTIHHVNPYIVCFLAILPDEPLDAFHLFGKEAPCAGFLKHCWVTAPVRFAKLLKYLLLLSKKITQTIHSR